MLLDLKQAGLYFFFGLSPYLALGIFLTGLIGRVRSWRRTPVLAPIPLGPALESRVKAAVDFLVETVTLSRLKGAGLVYRLAVFLIHAGLLLVFLRHLRYFLFPVPGWVMFFQAPGLWAGRLLVLVFLWLLLRRLFNRRLLYISTRSDYLLLLLILGIGLSGLAMHVWRVDLVAVKAYGLGLFRLSPVIPRDFGLFELHLLLVMIWLSCFPYSPMIHGLGLLFSPLRMGVTLGAGNYHRRAGTTAAARD